MGNCAGRASSHTPFVDVMVNVSQELSAFLNFPTAVQFPADAHDTDLISELVGTDWMSMGNCAGRASSHSPFVDVMVNTSLANVSLSVIGLSNSPTAVQLPGVAHDTEENRELTIWPTMPLGNSDGRASPQMPFEEDMVNANLFREALRNVPTAVQFPADAQDTESKNALRGSYWIPSGNTAGRAGSQMPFVEDMVNAVLPLRIWSNSPTAVQFPGDAHDTERILFSCSGRKTPLGNSAGLAKSHPLLGAGVVSRVMVAVNADIPFDEFEDSPTAVQFPGDVHETDVNIA
jgi:hypothetical protein